jgi:methylenetetrahydrofolate dehydrogenase (NADP+)/methenyltetrahydrofolate cyclohydrolase
MAMIIDGKAVAERLRAQLAVRIATLDFKPGLVVLRVGEDPASGVYVRNKDKAATPHNQRSFKVRSPKR